MAYSICYFAESILVLHCILPFFSQFFLKATQLEQMSSDYQLIIEQQDIIKNTLDRKQEVCIMQVLVQMKISTILLCIYVPFTLLFKQLTRVFI